MMQPSKQSFEASPSQSNLGTFPPQNFMNNSISKKSFEDGINMLENTFRDINQKFFLKNAESIQQFQDNDIVIHEKDEGFET